MTRTARRPLVLCAAALTLAACGSEPPPAAPPPPAVTVHTVQPQAVTLTRELPGRVRPSLVAEVRPQVSGIVAERLFTEGGLVQAGDPLYQLDDATYRAALASARASLERAQATRESARLSAARAAELVKQDAISRQEHENAVAALGQAEADVAAARAAVDAAAVALGYARITAPISGRIGMSAVTQGALVTANQAQALAVIQQLDPIYVDVTQSSRELLELRREIEAGRLERAGELPVTLLLEDGSMHAQQGTLAFSEVTVDPGTGSVALRVVVDNPAQILLPGMYVRAEVATGVRPAAILVPQRAVQRDATGRPSVMLVGAGDLVEQRQIEVSRTLGDAWLVDSGLAGGERVVVAGLQKIRPGAAVRPEAPATDAAPAK